MIGPFKKGDRIRLKPGVDSGTVDITQGVTYTVTGTDADGWPEFRDDVGDERCRPPEDYELVPDTSPFDLLAAMTGKPSSSARAALFASSRMSLMPSRTANSCC